MRLLALTLLLSAPALGQTTTCGAGVGGMVGVSPAGRDWDLSTPGPYAVTPSPVLSMRCARQPTGAWIGVDTTPLLRHTYSKLDGRGPLPITASVGMQIGGPYATYGPFYTTNGAAHGFGVRMERPLGETWLPESTWFRPQLDLRVARMGGRDAQYQAWAMIELTGVEPGQRARRNHGLPELMVHRGFEVGTVTGYRMTLSETPAVTGNTLPVSIGARVGVLTDLPRGRALEPIGLATVDLHTLGNNSLSLSGGGVLRDGELVPVVGLSRQSSEPGDSTLSMNTGLLAGRQNAETWLALDMGVSLMW